MSVSLLNGPSAQDLSWNNLYCNILSANSATGPAFSGAATGPTGPAGSSTSPNALTYYEDTGIITLNFTGAFVQNVGCQFVRIGNTVTWTLPNVIGQCVANTTLNTTIPGRFAPTGGPSFNIQCFQALGENNSANCQPLASILADGSTIVRFYKDLNYSNFSIDPLGQFTGLFAPTYTWNRH